MTPGGPPAHMAPPRGALPGIPAGGPTNYLAQQFGQQFGLDPRFVQSGLGALSSVGGAITGAMAGAFNGALLGGAVGAHGGGTSRPREHCCPSHHISRVSTDVLNSHGIYVYNAHSGAALPMTAEECLQALRPNGMVTDCDYTGMDLRGFDLSRIKALSSIMHDAGAYSIGVS